MAAFFAVSEGLRQRQQQASPGLQRETARPQKQENSTSVSSSKTGGIALSRGSQHPDYQKVELKSGPCRLDFLTAHGPGSQCGSALVCQVAAGQARIRVSLSLDQLRQFDGQQQSLIYLAVLGKIFDVSRNPSMYGACQNLQPSWTGKTSMLRLHAAEKVLNGAEISTTSVTLLLCAQDYRPVGTVAGRFYDGQGQPTELLRHIQAIKIARRAPQKAAAPGTKPCSIRWDTRASEQACRILTRLLLQLLACRVPHTCFQWKHLIRSRVHESAWKLSLQGQSLAATACIPEILAKESGSAHASPALYTGQARGCIRSVSQLPASARRPLQH
ncbi:Neuferricin [Sticta canariensis]|nr:Neuferricin [Sticta canariensis]